MLKELKPKEFLNVGGFIFLIGALIYSFFTLFNIDEITAKIAYNFIMPLGGLLLIIGVFKLKKEQKEPVNTFSNEEIEMQKQSEFKKYIFLIISIAVSVLITYWFGIRPKQIELECFKEAVGTGINIDIFGSSNTDGQMERVFQECLKRHGLEK